MYLNHDEKLCLYSLPEFLKIKGRVLFVIQNQCNFKFKRVLHNKLLINQYVAGITYSG